MGDSPLLLFRDGQLRQLNADHSMAPQIDLMVKVGAMKPEIGCNHPDRNTLMSALSGDKIEKIDCPDTPTRLQSGDILIVASDGVQSLSTDDMTSLLADRKARHSHDISQALLQAIDQAQNPEQDNAAFVVVKIGDMSQTVARQMLDRPRAAAHADGPVAQHRREPALAGADDRVISLPEKPASTSPARAATDTSAIPQKRVIRLVTSKTSTFDDPKPAQGDAGDIPNAASNRPVSWTRQQ